MKKKAGGAGELSIILQYSIALFVSQFIFSSYHIYLNIINKTSLKIGNEIIIYKNWYRAFH